MSRSKRKNKDEDKAMPAEKSGEEKDRRGAGAEAAVNAEKAGEVKEEKEAKEEGQTEAAEAEFSEVSEEEKLRKKVEELENEVASLKDQMLRKQAEMDNFRKRLLKDKEDSIKYSNSNLLTDLITVIDNFERAIQSSTQSKDFDSFHSGIELIEKQFTGMLENNWGLKRIKSVGEEFDPQKHEAIGMEESSEYDVETVVEDYQKGYILHDRVLRPAKVKVAVPSKGVPGEEKTTSSRETVAE